MKLKRGWKFDVQWFPRRCPYFAIGFDCGEFHLCLWVVDVTIWKY